MKNNERKKMNHAVRQVKGNLRRDSVPLTAQDVSSRFRQMLP